MYKKIGSEDVTIQVLSSQEDRAVINGLATSNGRYDLSLYTTDIVVPSQKANKSGNVTVTTEWTQLTGWTADAAYAGTTIQSNGLKATVTGSIMFSARLKATSSYANVRVQMRLNGEVISETAITGTATVSKVMYLAPNDLITIWVRRTNAVTGWWFGIKPISSATLEASGTYMMIEDYKDEGIDFEKDMVYGENKGFYDDSWGRYVSPSYLKTGLPFVTELAMTTNSKGFNTTYLSRGSVSGPILAQSRAPIPVYAGSKVNFKGTFRVRQTGTKDEKNEAGSSTGLEVRFSLWGIGTKTDEYGVELIYPQELMFYMATLQAAAAQTENLIEYVIPTLPDATVPEGVTGMVFTCSLVQTNGMTYGAGTFTSKTTQSEGQTVPPKSAAEMKYFGWAHAAPLEIMVDTTPVIYHVTKHPYSHTGVAFRNRKFFEGVNGTTECIFFGLPDTAVTVDIYNYDANTLTRGSLIGSYVAAAGERKVININASSDTIEFDSTGDYFVESVQNLPEYGLTQVKTRYKIENYTDINRDTSKISIIRAEAGQGSATIDLSTVDLDPKINSLLRVGKKIRILGRHYGVGYDDRPANWSGEALFDEVFTGIIKKVTATYDYKDEPIVQIVAYDAQDRFERIEAGVAFDTFDKFGPIFNRLGTDMIVEGYNWGGHVNILPDKGLLVPSATGDFPLIKGILMTRNTQKMYVHVDAKDRVIIDRTVRHSGITFADVNGQGDISFGAAERKSDTEDVINQIITNEHLLDQEDYADRSLSGDRPPADLRYPETKTQNGKYSNLESTREIGVMSKSFDVVRSVNSLRDLYEGKIGAGFKDWAETLLSSLSNTDVTIKGFTVPVRSSDQIRIISNLDVLDEVDIIFQGEETTMKIRSIDHTIVPGKWTTKLSFAQKEPGTYW